MARKKQTQLEITLVKSLDWLFKTAKGNFAGFGSEEAQSNCDPRGQCCLTRHA